MECKGSCLNMCGVQVVIFEYIWSAGCHVLICVECRLSCLNKCGGQIVMFELEQSAGCNV